MRKGRHAQLHKWECRYEMHAKNLDSLNPGWSLYYDAKQLESDLASHELGKKQLFM